MNEKIEELLNDPAHCGLNSLQGIKDDHFYIEKECFLDKRLKDLKLLIIFTLCDRGVKEDDDSYVFRIFR